MAPLVRGHDAWTAVEIAENSLAATWGDVPSGTTPYEWKALPILSETMTVERESYPKSKEFGESGALPFVEPGATLVKGTLVIQPRYNQEWFWNLIAQFMGDEVLTPDVDIYGVANGTNVCNQHAFVFASALSRGFGLRVWKGGATQAGYIQNFMGCMISRMVWEQPEDDVPKITLDILGKMPAAPYTTLASAGPLSTVGQLAGGSVITPIYVKPRDMSNVVGTDSKFQVGASLAQLNFRGFTLTVDRHLTFETAFANDPDNPEQPGVSETRDITMDIRSQVEQDYLAAGKPYREFLDKTVSKCRAVYASTSVVNGSQKFAIMLDFPSVVWEEARAAISEPGAPPSNFKFRATNGTFVTPATPPTGSAGDFRMICAVKPTDDGDAAWSVL